MGTVREIINRRELLLNLVVRNLKVRYKGSLLGFFWTLLDPLFMMLVYLLFIKLMRFSIEIPVLLTGVIAWQFFVMCANDSVGIITGSTNLVKKVYFPRVILPLAMSIANLVNFLLSLIVLFVLLLFFKISIGASIILFPLAVFLQFVLCLGMSLILSTSNVFFRDTEHLLGVILMTWFFLSPIIYPVSRVPGKFSFLYFLNPMASLIVLYRHILLGTALPAESSFYISFIIVFAVFALGYIVFWRFQRYFADEL